MKTTPDRVSVHTQISDFSVISVTEWSVKLRNGDLKIEESHIA